MKENIPNHIGIIMDGNGRWAKKRGLPRTAGHKEGLTVAKNIVAEAARLGVKFVTLYTFSTENWKRTEAEVGYLMSLIKVHLRGEFEFYKKNEIRIRHIGNLDGLPSDIRDEIINAQKETEHFSKMSVVLAINYGGRDEIVRGVKKLIFENVQADDITEEKIASSLDIADLPDVDLLIRTGGEERLSNFLMWQTAYAELIFSKTLWPDYTKEEFLSNIEEFKRRNRRFGGV